MSEEPQEPITHKPKIGTVEITLELNPKNQPVFDVKTPRGSRCVHATPRIKKSGVLFESVPRHSIVVALTYAGDVSAEPEARRLVMLPLGGWIEDATWVATVVSPIDPTTGVPVPGGFTISVFEIAVQEPLEAAAPSNADVLAGFDTTDVHPNQESDDAADPNTVH